MDKKSKIILCFLGFAILIAILFFLYLYSLPDLNTVKGILGKKHYLKFDDINSVTVLYHSYDGSPTFTYAVNCELEVNDTKFIKLIKNNYRNKWFNNYPVSILQKGEYEIVISDNIKLYTTSQEKFFCLDDNGKWYNIKGNKDLYNMLLEIMEPEIEKAKNNHNADN